MGMDADVIVIGPYGVLAGEGALDYSGADRYEGVTGDTLIIGTAARAWTSDQSETLARVCGVKLWDLGRHRVRHPSAPAAGEREERIGADKAIDVYHRIRRLSAHPGTIVWFRPNG